MHLGFCEKEKQLPEDILFDPDGHMKGSEIVAPSYYSHVCAREKRDVEKH